MSLTEEDLGQPRDHCICGRTKPSGWAVCERCIDAQRTTLTESIAAAHQRVWRWPAWKLNCADCPEPRCERALGHLAVGVPHGFTSFVEWPAGGAAPPPGIEIKIETKTEDDATSVRFSLLELD